MNKIIFKRLKPLYVATFLQSFILWYAVEKLFMDSIGFNNKSVVTATIAFTAVTLLLSFPLGIIADRWSRKNILIIASLALCLSSLICGLSNSVFIYTLGLCVWGLFSACYSGMFDSLIYDVLIEEQGKSTSYVKYLGKFELFNTAAFISGAFLSGIIAEVVNLRATYYLSVVIALCSVIPLILFVEPQVHKKQVFDIVSIHIKKTIQAIVKSKMLLWVVMAIILLTVSTRMLLEFGTLWFVALAMPAFFFGPAMALVQSAIGACGFIANFIRISSLRIVGVAILSLLGSFVLLGSNLAPIVISLAIMLLSVMSLVLILSHKLHDSLPSNLRVGASSLVYSFGLIVFLPIAFIFGEISERVSIFSASWVIIAIHALTALIIFKLKKTPSLLISTK